MVDLNSLTPEEIEKFKAEMFPDISPMNMTADELAQNFPESNDKKPDPPATRKIVIGLLGYDGRMEIQTHIALCKAMGEASHQGWSFAFIVREGDSMVARGRNFITSVFLNDPQCKDATDLVFVDTDLFWEGDEFLRLCSAPVDIIGGAYPYKDDGGNFPLRWPHDGLFEENGLWQVDAVTPGFLRMTRKAIEKIAACMPWLEYKDKGSAEGVKHYNFFENTHRPQGIWDEGYIFCEKWRTLGGKVWLLPDAVFTHIGKKKYKHGSIRQWIDKKAETLTHLEHEFPHVPPLKLLKKAMGEEIDLTKEGSNAADDQHSDAGPATPVDSNSNGNPQEHEGADVADDDISGRGRPEDAGLPQTPPPGLPTYSVGQAP